MHASLPIERTGKLSETLQKGDAKKLFHAKLFGLKTTTTTKKISKTLRRIEVNKRTKHLEEQWKRAKERESDKVES